MNMQLEKPLNLNFESEPQKNEALPPESSSAQAEPALVQQLDELKKELQAKNRQIEAKNKEISELKIKNRQLVDEVHDTQEKQKLMDEELRKAEVQIELIMELIGGESTNKPHEVSENNE